MYERMLKTLILIAFMLFFIILAGENMEKNSEEAIKTSAKVCRYEKIIALTFDDGPRSDTTKRLLDGLKERGIPATFFLVGENITGNEKLVERMKNEGHTIGNHTYTHVVLNDISINAALLEIKKTNDAIYRITGEMPQFVRPPCGEWDDSLFFRIDMTPVLWTIDPMDWRVKNASIVSDFVIKNAGDRDIILLHDIYDTSVEAAFTIIDELTRMGYKFVPIEDVILE